MMIERPGPSKHLSTLKDRYRSQQRQQKLHISSGSQRSSPGNQMNIFQEIFTDLSGFRYEPLRNSSPGAIECSYLDRKWPKLAQGTPKSKLMTIHVSFMLYQKYLKDETGSK